VTPDDRDESELARALDAYLIALESGLPLDPALLAALHPDIADRLLACIAVLDVTGGPRAGDDDPPGARLGDFALIRPIGRGGMGVVFEAREVSLDRRVAVKILPFAAALDPVLLGRFQVEARAAARLHHTNIVPVFSIGCERGVHYYAMQLIEGRSLADLIRDLRGDAPTPRTAPGRADEPPPTEPAAATVSAALPEPPPPRPPGPSHHRRVAELGVQAADALEHAHREGVVHRDVKPSNLMVDAKGTLWIADFGLARLEADAGLTLHGDLLGTLRYMSPEQSSGDPALVDARTDVFSLGATLYEFLTLRPARVAADRQALLAEIADGEPRPPRSIDRRIPRDLETIVLKALAREPDARYATAGAMADDLRRFLDGRPILARRPSPLARAARWARRRKGLVASAVLAALLGVASLTALALAARNRDLARAQRRADYVRDVAQAGQHARRNDLDEAVRLLSQHIPGPGEEDERDFAWRYLWRLGHTRPKRLEGHKGDVYHVEYSPDGRALITAGQDATIRTWNAETGAPLRTFRGHEGDVDWATFSPDGRAIASCGNDGSVRLWDASDETKPSRILGKGDQEVVAVVFSPDGRSVYSGDHAGRLTRWDIATGRGESAPDSLRTRVQSLAMASDGRTLVVACAGGPGMRWLDPASFRTIAADGDLADANGVAVAPSGRHAASGDRRGRVRIGDLGASGPDFRTLAEIPGLSIESVAFSRDGRKLAAYGAGGDLCVLDVTSPSMIDRFAVGPGRPWGVALSPDGRTLATAAEAGCVEIRDVEGGASRRDFGADVPCDTPVVVGWSDESLTTARADPSSVRFLRWTFADGKVGEVRTVRANDPYLVAVSDDQATAAFWHVPGSPRIEVVALDGRPAPSPPRFPSAPDRRRDFTYQLVFSADGSRLAATYPADGPVTAVWRVGEGPPLAPPIAIEAAERLTFAPDGARLALPKVEGLTVWDLTTGGLVDLPSHSPMWPTSSAFSRDGSLAAGGYDTPGIVAVWPLRSPRSSPLILGIPDVQALAFSPDGRLLAAADASGRTELLRIPSGLPILSLDGPPSQTSELRFSPDGSRLTRLAYGGGAAMRMTTWFSETAPATGARGPGDRP